MYAVCHCNYVFCVAYKTVPVVFPCNGCFYPDIFLCYIIYSKKSLKEKNYQRNQETFRGLIIIPVTVRTAGIIKIMLFAADVPIFFARMLINTIPIAFPTLL